MKTMLVTGGAGFIGGTFVRRVLNQHLLRVVNLDLLTYAGNLQSLAPLKHRQDHVFVHGDIRDTSLVSRLLEEHRPTCIAHFAAESHVDRSIGAPATFIETNVVGTQRLLDCARGYWSSLQGPERDGFRFLHVSTDEVFGSLGATGSFTEESDHAPNSPYAASKAAADHLVRAYHRTYGLPVLTSNCSNNYGPYQYPEKLIPLMIANAIDGQPLPVYGKGDNVRDWLHVEDHCAALEAILQRGTPGEVYNVGGGAERTNLQVVETLCRLVDDLCPELPHRPCRNLIQFVTDRLGHDQRYAIDSGKIRAKLAWRPRYDFEAGLRETVMWYLENRGWVQQVTAGIQGVEARVACSPAAGSPGAARAARPTPRYVQGPIDGVVFSSLPVHSDSRGWLIELFRMDELDPSNHPVMAYISETEPGVVRGPHEHRDQTDFFAFVGPGDFELRLWDARPTSPTHGNCLKKTVGQRAPVAVLVPPGVVHSYRNLSQQAARVFNSPNRLYGGYGKKCPIDEIRHEHDAQSPYEV